MSKLKELEKQFFEIQQLLDILKQEFKQEKSIVRLSDGARVGVMEAAGVINKEEQATLDELQKRADWIQTEINKLDGTLEPQHPYDKQILNNHDSEAYIDLSAAAMGKAFKEELQNKTRQAGAAVSPMLSSLNRTEPDNRFTSSTALDIVEKLLGISQPAISAAMATTRFIIDVVCRAYRSLQEDPKVNAWKHIYALQKSLTEFEATDEMYVNFVRDFSKATKTPVYKGSATVNAQVYNKFKDDFFAKYMNPKTIKNEVISHLAKNESRTTGNILFGDKSLMKSTGTVVLDYTYDKEMKRFEFDGGHIDDLGDGLQKIMEDEKSEDFVVDLPLPILVNIDTGGTIQANRYDSKPGLHQFTLSAKGDEDEATAKKIVEEFSKSNLLAKLKVSKIL